MIDPRYEDPNYDPQNPPSGPNIPDEPGPWPGDPHGTGDIIYEAPGPPVTNTPTTPPPPPPPPTTHPPPTTTEPRPPGLPPPTPSGSGSVAPLPAAGSAVPAPGPAAPDAYAGPSWNDILALFNKKPEITPIQQSYQDALLKFMGKAQTTPTLDDPNLAPQVEQYRVQAQRNQEHQRAAAVQRASMNGQNNSGYLNNAILRGIEEQGFNTAGFNAQLLAGQYDKQRQDLQAALQLAAATGNQEAQRELQARLAQVNAAMQQQDLSLRSDLGHQGLALQSDLGHGDLDLRRSIAQMQNNQFYDQLGVNTALGLEGLNQSALQRVLNGLTP